MIDENKYETVPPEADAFPLRLRRHSGAAKFFVHWHGHVELLYFIKGGATIYCNGEELLTEDGDLIIVNANELHRGDFRNTGVEYLCIMLPPCFFEWTGSKERYLFQKLIKKDEKIYKLISEIFKSFKQKENGYRYHSLGLAYELVAYLVKEYRVGMLDEKEYSSRCNKLEHFNIIIDYVGKNYAEPLDSSMMAGMMHLNEHYFCHLFKQYMGVNFTTYLNEVRVQKAVILLENTRLNVTQVAMNVGFSDVNYFSRVFKRYIGVSPKNFLKAKLF